MLDDSGTWIGRWSGSTGMPQLFHRSIERPQPHRSHEEALAGAAVLGIAKMLAVTPVVTNEIPVNIIFNLGYFILDIVQLLQSSTEFLESAQLMNVANAI